MQGRFQRTCPICGYYGFFEPAGLPVRVDAQCPRCGSLERHRLMYLRVLADVLFSNYRRVLHFAPEPILGRLIAEKADHYIAADPFMDGVDLRLDIEDIELADASFDAVVCNHVLEHVDDARALDELFRILKPGGALLCMVPIIEGWDSTYENHEVRSDSERALHFGQNDHLRWYGRDFRERVREAGFLIEERTADGAECAHYGLSRGETVFICKKPSA